MYGRPETPGPSIDYRSGLATMRRRYEGTLADPQSQEEFELLLKGVGSRESRRRERTVESDEEEEAFYLAPGYTGQWLFAWLCPSNPTRSRICVERLYWLAWKSVCHGVFLSGAGATLLVLGIACTFLCEEPSRGIALVIAALLLCIPGFYSMFILFMYVRGKKGYSYQQLPS